MTALAWVVAMFLVGLGIIVLEVFVPSGGVLGFVSLAAILASIVTAFVELGAQAGVAMIAITVVAVPLVLGMAFRWFPHTALGRRVLPPPPEAADVVPDAPSRRRARDLVGQTGTTSSDLLPWGTVAVGGADIEAVSESGPLDAGTPVEVVAAQGAAVVVRPRAAARPPARGPDPPRPAADETPPDRAAEAEQAVQPDRAPGDRLSPTLESFEFDALPPADA